MVAKTTTINIRQALEAYRALRTQANNLTKARSALSEAKAAALPADAKEVVDAAPEVLKVDAPDEVVAKADDNNQITAEDLASKTAIAPTNEGSTQQLSSEASVRVNNAVNKLKEIKAEQAKEARREQASELAQPVTLDTLKANLGKTNKQLIEEGLAKAGITKPAAIQDDFGNVILGEDEEEAKPKSDFQERVIDRITNADQKVLSRAEYAALKKAQSGELSPSQTLTLTRSLEAKLSNREKDALEQVVDNMLAEDKVAIAQAAQRGGLEAVQRKVRSFPGMQYIPDGLKAAAAALLMVLVLGNTNEAFAKDKTGKSGGTKSVESEILKSQKNLEKGRKATKRAIQIIQEHRKELKETKEAAEARIEARRIAREKAKAERAKAQEARKVAREAELKRQQAILKQFQSDIAQERAMDVKLNQILQTLSDRRKVRKAAKKAGVPVDPKKLPALPANRDYQFVIDTMKLLMEAKSSRVDDAAVIIKDFIESVDKRDRRGTKMELPDKMRNTLIKLALQGNPAFKKALEGSLSIVSKQD